MFMYVCLCVDICFLCLKQQHALFSYMMRSEEVDSSSLYCSV